VSNWRHAGDPNAPLLRTAYDLFRAGEFRAALALLEPVLGSEQAPVGHPYVAGILCGLAGDCYFKLGEPEKGFRAYRRAIDLDPGAGCLALFAYQVAKHRRGQDAEFALRCLAKSREADRQAFRRHPIHFLSFALRPSAILFQLVQLPIARWRLRRLAARWRDTESV
jgi:tetratricopeptide (TPR) repeat protein